MATDIAAIPTLYRGMQFRSRLEAKWAAFFDRCGWRWSYEPLDLPGWIPDFAIGWRPSLVEVKPFFHEHQFADVLQQLNASGHQDPVVLLGAAPRFDLGDWDGAAIGWLAEWWTTTDSDGVTRSAFEVSDLHIGWTEGNGCLGLCPMEGAWVNLIWEPPAHDAYANKWSRVHDHDYVYLHQHTKSPGRARDQISAQWALACNSTQWNPRDTR